MESLFLFAVAAFAGTAICGATAFFKLNFAGD